MAPIYATCPHCDFPAVVRGCERSYVRRCRQCRGRYIPGGGAQADDQGKSDQARVREKVTRRTALRTLLKKRWRSAG
jgi:hypothetical protein